MKHYGDICKINGADLEPVDVICGGSPCQDLSVANRYRNGLQGERSGLFYQEIRVIKEMLERDRSRATEPFHRVRWVVWENVPGCRSSNGGEDYRILLQEFARLIQPEVSIVRPQNNEWARAGLILLDGGSIAWRETDAQYWGTPQRRRRMCVLVDLHGQSAGDVLFEECDRETYETNTNKAESDPNDCAGKIPAQFSGLQGNPCESQAERQETSGEADDGTGETICIEMTSTKNTVSDSGICPTLTARMGTGGNQVNVVLDAVAIHEASGQDMTFSDVAYSVTTGGGKAGQGNPVVFAMQGFGDYKLSDSASTVKSRDYKDNTDLIVTEDVLRKLMPEETEILQGYPVGWTNIGAWTDTKGKLHKCSSDASRYKALGNSICLPFWIHVAKRISATYCYDITMGSLFDGIGGFPLAFERCNGRGSARWASEIEEFCIAVTKYHFGDE